VTKLCVPITEKDTDAALAAMRSLPAEVDAVELRLDMMESCDLERLCGGKDRPVIATNRPVREGGRCTAAEPDRLAVLRRAAELGADFVDVELSAVPALGELPGTCRRIVSHHDTERTPPDLPGLLRRIVGVGPHVAKIAVTARGAADVPPVLDLLRHHAGKTPLIALPGQLTLEQMLGMYRFRAIGPSTAVYGVVANPVAHSMSPAVHNAAFAERGLDAVYLPFKVLDPARFLCGFEPYELKGLSVTLPHKEAMLPLMDEVDELATAVGAVNTVALRDGRRYGCNTDVAAAAGSIEGAAQRAGLEPLSERTVLLVGAGGAARAIALGLRGKVGRLVIANRTVSRARALAAELGAEACGLDELGGVRPDVVVNSTSVGMWPNVEDCAVPADMLRPGMVVFDAVYNPVRTRLLTQAEAAGAVTATGLEWFVGQAAAQFELWTGRPAPREVMVEVLRGRLEAGNG